MSAAPGRTYCVGRGNQGFRGAYQIQTVPRILMRLGRIQRMAACSGCRMPYAVWPYAVGATVGERVAIQNRMRWRVEPGIVGVMSYVMRQVTSSISTY